MKMDSSSLLEYAAGAISGCVGVLFGHPLDTIKTQLQVQLAENKYKGPWDCLKTIYSQDLSHGFFRGLSWPLLSYGLVNSVFFGTYYNTLKYLNGDVNHDTGPRFLHIFIAGSVGGTAQLGVAVPIEVIKVVLQAQIPHNICASAVLNKDYYKGPLEGTKDIIRTQGIKGMYRGLVTQFCRDVPASAAYFSIFEFSSFYGHKHIPMLKSQVINFIAGGLAGVLSWTLIMPFDVVKQRVQADVKRTTYTGIWDCGMKSLHEEGLKVFFRGYTVVAVRAFLVNAATLLAYVEILKVFKREG